MLMPQDSIKWWFYFYPSGVPTLYLPLFTCLRCYCPRQFCDHWQINTIQDLFQQSSDKYNIRQLSLRSSTVVPDISNSLSSTSCLPDLGIPTMSICEICFIKKTNKQTKTVCKSRVAMLEYYCQYEPVTVT